MIRFLSYSFLIVNKRRLEWGMREHSDALNGEGLQTIRGRLLLCQLCVNPWKHKNTPDSSDKLTAAIGLAFCRTSDAEGDGADEPEGEGGRVDGIHAVGDVGRVRACRRRCRGRQRRFIAALLADVHGRSAGQLGVSGLHLQHEPVSTAASQRASLPPAMARTSSSSG